MGGGGGGESGGQGREGWKLQSELSHITFMKMKLFLPSADSGRACVSYWQKYMHKVLVNGLED